MRHKTQQACLLDHHLRKEQPMNPEANTNDHMTTPCPPDLEEPERSTQALPTIYRQILPTFVHCYNEHRPHMTPHEHPSELSHHYSIEAAADLNLPERSCGGPRKTGDDDHSRNSIGVAQGGVAVHNLTYGKGEGDNSGGMVRRCKEGACKHQYRVGRGLQHHQ
jgi:hypothetical protein